MNNVSNTESLVEFYHLPGLGVKETATILTTGSYDSCHAVYSHHKRAKDLAEFRNKVYGEPIPVEFVK